MISPLSCDTIGTITNPDFKRYALRYAGIEQSTLQRIEEYGLPFNRSEELLQITKQLKQELAAKGAVFANNGKSIHINWLSDACKACRTGEGSYTSFLSLKCHRDCYFCFNPNQENYDGFQHQMRDARSEIEQLAEMKAPLTHVALTGGEPLLYKQESIGFFNCVNQRFPQAHSRLYTAGDPLDAETVVALQQAGLQEIRFSIKIDDSEERQQRVLRRIALARQHIPTVMVEMPVIPGTREEMGNVLVTLDNLGVDGINLLEFCFPLNKAEAYQSRHFTLKYPPYEVYYNYWYAGGLAVAESERLCLELLLFALEKNLRLGVHYCSLENKHTGQVYQQNTGYDVDDTLYFSPVDYFYKTARAFGNDVPAIQQILKQNGVSFRHELQHNFIQFHPSAIPLLTAQHVELCIASHLIEQDEEGIPFIKEVGLAKTTPALFEMADIQGVAA